METWKLFYKRKHTLALLFPLYAAISRRYRRSCQLVCQVLATYSGDTNASNTLIRIRLVF